MAQVVHTRDQRVHHLEADCLVGRSPQASLRLGGSYVSNQHAAISWTRDGWFIRDLGSHNGTWVGGRRISAGQGELLSEGTLIQFGHRDETWQLIDASIPDVLLIRVANGEQLVVQDTVLGLPSDVEPLCTLYKRATGVWCFEAEDGSTLSLENGSTFVAGTETYRFCLPDTVESTVTASEAVEPEDLRLEFLVSLDEEYVELRLLRQSIVTSLGARSHNYLLLELARARLRDQEEGAPASSCGWTYKEDLVSRSQSPERVDNEVFRIRKHLAQLAPGLADRIVERRPRTRQLRIGVESFEIRSI